MKYLGLFLILILGVSFVSAEGEETESSVLELTDQTLGDALGSHQFIFVEFYAPWCGHCQQLAPEWEKAATTLKEIVPLAKINADENRDAALEWGIQGFPTLKWFENGRPYDYNGPRDANGIVQWVLKRIDPIPKFDSLENLDIARSISDVVVIFNYGIDSPEFATMRQYALSAESITFILATGEAAETILPGDVIVSSHWKEPTKFTGALDELPSWVNQNFYPLVQEITENGVNIFQRLFSSGVPFALVFLSQPSEADLAELTKVAEHYRGRFLLAWLEAETWGGLLPRLGATGDYVPTAIAWEAADENNPKMPLVFNEDEAFTFEAFSNWAQQILDGTAQSWRRSQPVPEENEGPVRVVVWKTFEKEVLNSEVPVFLKFYSPECAHCVALAPAWEELAQTIPKSVAIIAKIDVTRNHIPEEYDIQGIPTLKLFFPGKAPIDYEGTRDTHSLTSYLNLQIQLQESN